MATKTADKSTAPASTAPVSDGAFVDIDTTDWIDERFGFAPYWSPKEGEFIIARLVARDERDPEFVRFLLETMRPMVAYAGPKKSQEAVRVEPGETFTISSYYQVDMKFAEYMDLGVFPILRLTAVEKVKTTGTKTVWKFKAQLHPDTVKQLNAARQARALNATKPKTKRAELEA